MNWSIVINMEIADNNGAFQDSVRAETINILRAMADDTWTISDVLRGSKAYRAAWSSLVEARHVVNVEIIEASHHFPGDRPITFPAHKTGWTITLSGLAYLRELNTHPLRLLLNRHWFPLIVAATAVVSSVVSAVTLIVRGIQ